MGLTSSIFQSTIEPPPGSIAETKPLNSSPGHPSKLASPGIASANSFASSSQQVISLNLASPQSPNLFTGSLGIVVPTSCENLSCQLGQTEIELLGKYVPALSLG